MLLKLMLIVFSYFLIGGISYNNLKNLIVSVKD